MADTYSNTGATAAYASKMPDKTNDADIQEALQAVHYGIQDPNAASFTSSWTDPQFGVLGKLLHLKDEKIEKSIFTAKGQLLSATATSTPSVLAPSTNGYVLKLNSSTSTGLEWYSLDTTHLSLSNSGSQTIIGDVTISKASPLLKAVATSGHSKIVADALPGQYSMFELWADSERRWVIYRNNSTESGGNVGSDLYISNYDDNGDPISTPLHIKRSSGLTTLTSLTVAGAITGNGAAVINSTLNVTGLTTLANATITGTTNLSGTVTISAPTVTGTASLANLTTSGTATIGSTATFNGAATFNSTVAHGTTTTFTGLATFNGGIAVNGNQTVSGTTVLSGKLTTVASALGSAGLNLPPGTTPSGPVSGDMWITTAGVYARIGTTTYPLASVAVGPGGLNMGDATMGVLASQYGGTGVDNTGKAITLAGNLITSGAFAITLTSTGTTNVTLPTSGTLATSTSSLAQFAATTSAQLRGVISDETGTGSLVFNGSPTFTGTVELPNTANFKSANFDSGYVTFGLVTIGRSGSGYGTIGDGYRTTSVSSEYQYDRGSLGNEEKATMVDFASGNISFRTAPAGIAGNTATFTTKMQVTSSGVSVNDTTESSSSVTGSFKTSGGMGVAKKLYVGTDLNIGGAAFAPTATAGTSTTQLATTEFVRDNWKTTTAVSPADWNTIIAPGPYNTLVEGSATNNAPTNGDYYYLVNHIYNNTNQVMQIAYPYSTTDGSSFLRTRYQGTWASWHRILSKTYADTVYAPLASPNLTGTPTISSVAIATVNTNWSAADITSGTLATAQGGTGLASFTANKAVYATSTSALTTGTLPVVAGGTGTTTSTGTGNVVLSAAPQFSGEVTFAGGSSVTLPATVDLGATGATGTTPSHYYVEVGGLGKIYSRTLANVRIDIVTKAAMEAATSVTFPESGTLATTATNWSAADITSGTLAVARGGTGLASFTSGGALYATSTSALTTGTLPVASGGTGVTTSTGTGSVVLSAAPQFSGEVTFTGDSMTYNTSNISNWWFNNSVHFRMGAGYTTLVVDVQDVSDIKLKQNVKELPKHQDAFDRLSPKSFEFKNNPGVTRYGFIANEVEEAGLPILDDNGTKSINALTLVALLWEKVKEQEKRLKVLEAKK